MSSPAPAYTCALEPCSALGEGGIVPGQRFFPTVSECVEFNAALENRRNF